MVFTFICTASSPPVTDVMKACELQIKADMRGAHGLLLRGWAACNSLSNVRMVYAISHIHARIQWMADPEARAALVGGAAADGRFWPEKLRLCDETDSVLDKLENGLKRRDMA